jgi:hypothetical protein
MPMFDLLKGVRIIEFGILLNGDHLGMLLSDLGAEVIKVEEPLKGDYLRDMLGQITPHHSPAHLQVNKNKKSVTLNVNTDEGRRAFFALLKTADILRRRTARRRVRSDGHRLRGAMRGETRHHLYGEHRLRHDRPLCAAGRARLFHVRGRRRGCPRRRTRTVSSIAPKAPTCSAGSKPPRARADRSR